MSKKYPTESAAHAAADALRLTINNRCEHRNLRRTTINTLWEHYSQEELPLKASVHTRRVHDLRKELDCPTLGQSATGTSQNRRGGALATSDRSGGWDQSQNQVCDVGFVFARRSVGVLWPQSHLVGHSGRKWRKRGPRSGSASQCQAPNVAVEIDGRASGTKKFEHGSNSATSFSCFWMQDCGNPSRGTRGTAVAGLRLRQHEFSVQHSY